MKKTGFIFLIILLVLAGCSRKSVQTEETGILTFTDVLGKSVEVEKTERVIAASGSFAQIWLLSGGTLTGTTSDAFNNYSNIPEDTVDVGGVLEPSLETIIALEPDLVILSADMSAHLKLGEQLETLGIKTAFFSVENFSAYLHMLQICTTLTGREDLYQENGLDVETRINSILSQIDGEKQPKILLLRTGAGKVTARNSDSMAGQMLKDMGCINIADSEDSLLDQLSMEVILQEDPDYIFVVNHGSSEEEAQAVLEETLLSNPAWESLTAVKNGHYFTLPKELFHLKPNEKWDEAYAYLWEILFEE